ncbi:DUF6969 family protein [Acidiphilium acidophilum]|uniref:DUF6969 family protein n=1 Tax=Acidiphilium acidophilum TaxID=76588 RepID=UPI002E8E6690|nr:hypothetical protein [Acidiphilium acidophilum]
MEAARSPARQLAAAARLVTALRRLEDRGSNLAANFIRGRRFIAEAHYPAPDVFDSASGCQYYFHAHDAHTSNRTNAGASEIGHIHVFARPNGVGMPPIHHLIAIALDPCGRPCGLFTTNRWVTGEDFLPAPAAISLARRLRLRGTAPASRVIDALLILYATEIATLLTARDARIAAAQAELGPHVEAFEHRDLEITSSLPIDLPARLADLRSLIPETGTDPAMVGTRTV